MYTRGKHNNPREMWRGLTIRLLSVTSVQLYESHGRDTNKNKILVKKYLAKQAMIIMVVVVVVVVMVIIIIIIIIIISSSSSSSSSSIYNCIPETNHVSRVYTIDAVL